MPSTINPSTIDPSKPTTGTALTQDVRDNEQATQDNFTAAVNDINGLESSALPEAPIDGSQYAREDAAWTPVAAVVQSHHNLTDLTDGDDHTQYLNDARGDARYAPLTHVGAAGPAHGDASGAQAGFLTASDFSKLAGIAPGAQPGDMLKATYDPTDDGIVEYSRTVAGTGTNNTGALIGKGIFVQVAAGSLIAPAEPQTGMWAIAATDEAIANTASGRGILQGLITGVDTSGGSTGDLIYLGPGGTWTTVKVTDKDSQVVGVLWTIDPVVGTLEVKIGDPVAAEVEGATGILAPASGFTAFNHLNASGLTWTEVVPGAGQSQVLQLANMVAGSNPGRIAFDYSGTSGPLPFPAGIQGSLTIHFSLEFLTADTQLDMAIGLNGDIFHAELATRIAIGGPIVVGTVTPATLTAPISGLSDGDELSIMTRGSVATFNVHSLEIAFNSLSGVGGGGGGGGTDFHNLLQNRNLADQHITSAITGLDAALASKALATDLTAHETDPTGAHAASAVSVVPVGNLAATDAQAGLAELDSDLGAHVGAGGAEHALVVPSGAAGFMSGADKTLLDGFVAGGADMLSPGPGTMTVGELYAAGDVNGVQTAPAGFGTADVARLSQANPFIASPQSIAPVAGDAVVKIQSADGVAKVDFTDGGSPNVRAWEMVSEAAQFVFRPLLDNGLPAGNSALTASHSGGAMIGNPSGGLVAGSGNLNATRLLVQGQDVYHPGNLPPAGGLDVTSADATVEGEIQLGSAITRGIKGLVRGAVDLPLVSGGTGAGAGPVFAQLKTIGIEDAAVTFAKMQNFQPETVLLRGLGTGPPTDARISGLANHVPAAGDFLLVETAIGLLRHSIVGALPGGGNVTSPGTTDQVVQVGSSDATGIEDSAVDIASVVRTDVSTTYGQIGNPATSTDLTAQTTTPAPTYVGNAAFYTNHSGSITITVDVSAEGWFEIVIDTLVDAVAFSIAPDLVTGTDSGLGTLRSLVMKRINGNTIAQWGSA